MTKPTDAAARYVLDGSDADLRRLLRIASVMNENTRTALGATPIAPGWTAMDCGCGPLGAMAILADVVGPTGRVAGLDFHPDTVERARTVLAELGLDGIEVRTGDINDPECDTGGPYDLVFTRCFLMHQADPRRTLERIASHLRPGGWVVAMEPLWQPQPFASSAFPVLADAWDMLHRATVGGGASPDAVADLPEHARRAGFALRRAAGMCEVVDWDTGASLHAATTRAARERIVATGAASADEVDAAVNELESVHHPGGWVSTPLFLTLALQLTG